MENGTYIILPGCDDTNRGDQALIWETVSLAKEAGFWGSYFMIAEEEKSRQSLGEGIQSTGYILRHPSARFKDKSNIHYGAALKIKWVFASVLDSIMALSLCIPFVRTYFLCLFPNRVQKSIGVFKRANAAFVKGGGFLHTYGSLIETYITFFNLYHIILAHSMKIPVYIMPNSYGPLDSPGSKFLVRWTLKKCKFVSARECLSQKFVESLGIGCKLYPDLAFFLKEMPVFDNRQLEKMKNIPFGERVCVALTMRPYRFPGSSHPQKDYESYKVNLCEFIKYLSRKNYLPVLIEHTFSDTEHERDSSCIYDVVKRLENSCEYIVYSDQTLNSRQLKYVYSKFDYIVGTRFHSVIFSLASKVPAIAITYGGNKGEGIMMDMGLSGYTIPIDKLTSENLIQKFEDLTQNKKLVLEEINAYLSALSTRRDKLKQEISIEE